MKRILILAILGLGPICHGQAPLLNLSMCTDSAIHNRTKLKIKNADLAIAELQKELAISQFLPQITLDYEYRYNPVIPSQIVPTGLFKSTPDEEKRAIQFGTKWQQNLGVSLFQPVIDLTIKSKIAEARLSSRISQLDARLADEDLRFEVARSFSRIFSLGKSLDGFAIDTLRTSRSYNLIKNRFDEGKILKTELNNAQMVHHNALSDFGSSQIELAAEKIYLGYLTGIAPSVLLAATFDFTVFEHLDAWSEEDTIHFDSLISDQRYALKLDLIAGQVSSEERKRYPTVGIQGFLGADQYTNGFDPAQNNSWFGRSYVGLALKVPLLRGENTSQRISQLRNEAKIAELNRQDWRESQLDEFLRTGQEIRSIRQKITYAEQNVALMAENVVILTDRFDAGQLSASELNIQQTDLQKQRSTLLHLQSQLVEKQLMQLKNAGAFGAFIASKH